MLTLNFCIPSSSGRTYIENGKWMGKVTNEKSKKVSNDLACLVLKPKNNRV